MKQELPELLNEDLATKPKRWRWAPTVVAVIAVALLLTLVLWLLLWSGGAEKAQQQEVQPTSGLSERSIIILA